MDIDTSTAGAMNVNMHFRALKHGSFLVDTFLSQSTVKFSCMNEEAVSPWPPVL